MVARVVSRSPPDSYTSKTTNCLATAALPIRFPKALACGSPVWSPVLVPRDLATNPGWAGPEIAERGLPPPFHTALLPLVN
jgi:hypothetical protein